LSQRPFSQTKSKSSNDGKSTPNAMLSQDSIWQSQEDDHSSSKSEIVSSGSKVAASDHVQRAVQRVSISSNGTGANPLQQFAASRTSPPNCQAGPCKSGERGSINGDSNCSSRPPLQERQDASTVKKRPSNIGQAISNDSNNKRNKNASPNDTTSKRGKSRQIATSSTPVDEKSPTKDRSLAAPTPSKLWTSVGVDASMFDCDDDHDLEQEVEALLATLSTKVSGSVSGHVNVSNDDDLISDADKEENDPALNRNFSDDSLSGRKQQVMVSLLFNPSAVGGLGLDGGLFSDDDDDD
jgi:hypothetical protein